MLVSHSNQLIECLFHPRVYCSSTYKIPVILPKVQVTAKHMDLTYVALNKVTL